MVETGYCYHVNEAVTAPQVAALYRRAGLERPVDDLDRIQRMLDHAGLTVAALDTNPDGSRELVGFARVLTDFAYHALLADLAVDPACRNKGVGKHLLDHVLAELGPETNLVVVAESGAEGYFPHVGLTALPDVFHVARDS